MQLNWFFDDIIYKECSKVGVHIIVWYNSDESNIIKIKFMEGEEKIKASTKKVVKKKKSILKELFIVGVFSALVVALVVVSLAYTKEKNKKITSADIQALQQQEVGMVLDEIAKHMILPEGVQPTVATITNVDNLRKEMPFFDNAENGFKVVVYEDKAILFDPSRQIIVDVAPVYQRDNDPLAIKQQDEKQQKDAVEETDNDDVENEDNEDNEDVEEEKEDVDESVEEDEGAIDDKEESTDKE